MKEAGEIAEQKSSKKVTLEHTKNAFAKLDDFKFRCSKNLEEEEMIILNLVKENSGKKIKEVYDAYRNMGGGKAYSTFHRKINDLKNSNLVETEEVNLGEGGKSHVVKYIRKLNEF